MPSVGTRDFGWYPDLADHRDYSLDHRVVRSALHKLKMRTRKAPDLPASVDWREYCGPIEDQQERVTSTAHACVALVQQFERRATGRLLRLSPLFVHQCACRLLKAPIDSPIPVRMALKAVARFGVPPEEYWPYDREHFELQPDAFAYGFQRGLRGLSYARLDQRDATGEEILVQSKVLLAAGFSFMFGFPICVSRSDDADIPFPTVADRLFGGQAVVAVGYDDKRRIRSDKGALLVRNSWGVQWGDRGFGWLPYAYVRQRLAVDLWTLLKPAWLRSGEFEPLQ